MRLLLIIATPKLFTLNFNFYPPRFYRWGVFLGFLPTGSCALLVAVFGHYAPAATGQGVAFQLGVVTQSLFIVKFHLVLDGFLLQLGNTSVRTVFMETV